MYRRLTIWIASVVVALGCSNPLTPAEVVGTYTLATIDDRLPPRLLGATIECDDLLAGGELELLPAPDWSVLTFAREHDCTRAGGGVSSDTLRYLGRFRLRDATLTFETELSLEDTLRFSGPARLGSVTLVVRDTIRGLGGPMSIRFDR